LMLGPPGWVPVVILERRRVPVVPVRRRARTQYCAPNDPTWRPPEINAREVLPLESFSS
jgi:hypothetical protein